MRRVAGLLATGLGAFLLAFGLLLRFYVPGQVITFPLNEYSVTTMTGTHFTYFSPTSLKEFANVRVTAIRTLEGDVKSGSSSTAVWGSFTALNDNTNHVVISDTTQRSAFNRRSGLLVNCCAATIGAKTVHQAGQGFTLPFGTAHRTYQIFDVTLLQPVPLTFAGTATIDGMAVDRFVEHVANQKFGQQTLAGPIVGQKQPTVTLPEYLTATNTYWVDPVTGRIVDQTLDQRIALETASGTTALVLLGGSLAQTPASVQAAVTSAAHQHAKIEWIQDKGPLIGLVAGLVLLILGSWLVWRAARPAVDIYDDEDADRERYPHHA
jgi:Porin PorA